jgi:hypothetical protein
MSLWPNKKLDGTLFVVIFVAKRFIRGLSNFNSDFFVCLIMICKAGLDLLTTQEHLLAVLKS